MSTEISKFKIDANGYKEVADVQVEDEKDFHFKPDKDSRFVLVVTNNDSNDVDVTIKAGDRWASQRLGEDADLKVEGVGDGETVAFGALESARFKDEDEKINVLVETAGTAGTDEDIDIYVLEIALGE